MADLPLAAKVNRTASALLVPQSVVIELTRACNQDCYYCYVDRRRRRAEMTAPDWKKALEGMARAGTLYVTFSGGEPFLRKDLLEILAEARKSAFAVSLITNGHAIDGKMADRLAALALMDVGVSLLASDAKTHDRLAGLSGSFTRAVKALKFLKERGVRTLIKHTVSNANFGHYRKLKAMAKSFGALFEVDTAVVPPHGIKAPSHWNLDQARFRIFARDMKLRAFDLDCGPGEHSNLACDAGRSVAGISPEGEIYPCVLLPLRFGNVRQGFLKAWRGARARAFRREILVSSDKCLACPAVAVCARCPGVSFMETGELTGVAETLCRRTFALKSAPNGVIFIDDGKAQKPA